MPVRSIGDIAPDGPDWIPRKFAELEKQIKQLRTARSLDYSAVGNTGQAITDGAFVFPPIEGGTTPGSMYWEDGFPHHAAMYETDASTGNELIIQGASDEPATHSPFFIIEAVTAANPEGASGLGSIGFGNSPGYAPVTLNLNHGNNGMRSKNTADTSLEEYINLGYHGHHGPTGVIIDYDVPLQVGTGPLGRYYYEEWTLAPQAIPSGGALTTLTGMTLTQTAADYPTALDLPSGIWTCPVGAAYTFTLYGGFATWTANARLRLRAINTAANAVIGDRDASPNTTTDAMETLSARRWVDAGETVMFQISNGTGSALNVQTIAPESSYLSIQREL